MAAGLSVAAMVVPQGLSYAKLAGLPQVWGLYGAFSPCIVYAGFGSSKQLVCTTSPRFLSLALACVVQSSASKLRGPRLLSQFANGGRTLDQQTFRPHCRGYCHVGWLLCVKDILL